MWTVFAVGTGLRLAQYLTNRSLWYDEALLALNILGRPVSGLFRSLDYHQGAPIGFLLLEKLVTSIAGNGELALRAVPLAAGIFALMLFWCVAEALVCRWAALVAFSLFALCGPLIYYSSEAKQYSSDVAVVLWLFWMVLRLTRSEFSTYDLICLSIAGAIGIWFSHPASFELAGVGAALIGRALAGRDWRRLRRLSWVFATWGLSFLSCYLVSLRHLSKDQVLLGFWQNYFPPHPLWSLRGLSWSVERYFALFSDPAGLQSILGAALFVAGGAGLARRNRGSFWLLAGPLALTLLAASLHKYPLTGRLLLFAVPTLLVFVAEGAVWIAHASGRFSKIVTIVLFAVLVAKPVWISASKLIHPDRPEDIKLALQFVQRHQQPGDVWYVYHWARYAFRYYSGLYALPTRNVIIGVDCDTDAACYAADLDKLCGKPRVWLLFSHIWIGDGLQEEDVFLKHLDRLGTRREAFRSTGARAYLYDLSRTPGSCTNSN